ncbi:unnamed protein product [Linum trigynum]|uniref:DUF4283 domain-containing protein n=1 Tax=Linum trigynum TaxID=586398 RepID=A0AAV2CUW5_9ROSI
MSRIAEDQVVEFSLEEVQSGRFRTSRTLLGRLFSEARLTTLELRDVLIEAWWVKGNLRVSLTKFGLFEVVLPSDETRVWVLKRTPWIVKDRNFHLRSWTPSISRVTFDELAIAPFPVQLWNVKDDCFTKQFGRKVATGTIGQVLEADDFASKDTEEFFVKVLALIDFTKPLSSQIMAVSAELGSFWVNLKYEFLPTICFYCGRVGNSKRDSVFDSPLGKERYGPHMSTRKLGRKICMAEEDYPNFWNISKSVWVNKNVQRQNNGSAKIDRGRVEEVSPMLNDRAQDQGVYHPVFAEPEAQPRRKPQPRLREPNNKVAGNHTSPKKFVIKKLTRAPHHQQGVIPLEVALEQSRRRMMILQEESEEEETADVTAVHPIQSRIPSGPAKDPVHKPPMDPQLHSKTATQPGVLTPRARPRLRKDLQSFEIKRRSPNDASRKTCPVMKGCVHQVVEAFEAGLVIVREERAPYKGSRLNLNEYGSNLVDPLMENRKHVLEELDGDVGDPPTPKKQFVESANVLEKVEEASLEWPPADK